MPIGELLGALEREAAAEVAAIGTAAAAEAERLAAEAAARRAESIRHDADAYRAEVQGRADVEVAAAARRARGRVLAARAAMLERLRAATLAALPALVDDALRARLRAAAGASRRDDTVERAAPTGLHIELDGGRVTIDATLAGLLARLWPRLAIEAIREAAP